MFIINSFVLIIRVWAIAGFFCLRGAMASETETGEEFNGAGKPTSQILAYFETVSW